MDFAVPADHKIKWKENEKKDKYLDLARELKKLRNIKVTITPIVINAFGIVRLENKRTSGDHLNNITDIGQNTEKRPGDLRRFAVIQTSVNDH